MSKEYLKNLTNKELYKLLNKADWLDKDLLREYDERSHDGRIPSTPIHDLEEHFRKRRENKAKKAS